MTRAAVRPRRAALWRAAPVRLLRTPGWLVLVLVAATLFVASVVAPPMFSATARATALSESLGAAAGAPYGAESADLRVTWDAVLVEDGNDLVMSRLEAIEGYGSPVVTARASPRTAPVGPSPAPTGATSPRSSGTTTVPSRPSAATRTPTGSGWRRTSPTGSASSPATRSASGSCRPS